MSRRGLAMGLLVLFAGCRCGAPEGEATAKDAGQPPMPTGMLVPLEAGPVVVADAGPGRRMAMVLGETSGSSVEIQIAPKGESAERRDFVRGQKTSRYLSVEAMTLLHEPFARALPRFDLFVPRLLGPHALERLATELATFEKDWSALGSRTAASEKWATKSSFIDGLTTDAEWSAAKTALLATIGELRTLASERAKRDEGLWVLPP